MTKISAFLYRITASLPCRLIHRGKDERYLERYWVGRLIGCTAYLHRFVASDADEWVHDHPWRWSVAIVLTGGYREERLEWFDPATGWFAHIRKLGGWRRINIIKGGDFHRIIDCTPETWTLFIHGRRIKGWGFLKYTQCRPPEPGMTTYHQPYNIAATVDWHTTRPAGCNADRAPLKETA